MCASRWLPGVPEVPQNWITRAGLTGVDGILRGGAEGDRYGMASWYRENATLGACAALCGRGHGTWVPGMWVLEGVGGQTWGTSARGSDYGAWRPAPPNRGRSPSLRPGAMMVDCFQSSCGFTPGA